MIEMSEIGFWSRVGRPSTDAVDAVLAKQIVDENDITGTIAKVTNHDHLIIAMTDGRWACYDIYGGNGCITLRTNPPSVAELYYAGLLTDIEIEPDMSALPPGCIRDWPGDQDPPAGWFLCDGSNDTPDLRRRFIVARSEDGGPRRVSVLIMKLDGEVK